MKKIELSTTGTNFAPYVFDKWARDHPNATEADIDAFIEDTGIKEFKGLIADLKNLLLELCAQYNI